MNNTFLIVAIVVVVWAVLFVIMMSFNKKRQAKANEFNNENRDRAIVHLYGKDLKIDGNDISHFDTTTGESLEKVVALDAGKHSFEGIFENCPNISRKRLIDVVFYHCISEFYIEICDNIF